MLWNKKRVYLDCAAGAAGNPSSAHEEGRKAKKQLEDARVAIARLVEVQADDVIFTSGATESNALAILGYVRAARKNHRNNAHVLYLPSAHASIVENMKLLAEEGVTVEALPIFEGRVDTELLAGMITANTVLISMDAVCGETGVVWNTREVAEVLRRVTRDAKSLFSLARGTAATPEENRLPVALHVDASQAVWTEKITRAHFDADLVTFDASKVGVRGIGTLIARRTIPLEPFYRGGGQERGLRPGSENPEAAEGFAAALSAAAAGREAFRAVAEMQRSELVNSILSSIPDVLINDSKSQSPNILNISLPGHDTDYLVALLDEAGFAVSTRSACETDSQTGSRAVLALTGDSERAKATVRISWEPGTRSLDATRFVHALTKSLDLC